MNNDEQPKCNICNVNDAALRKGSTTRYNLRCTNCSTELATFLFRQQERFIKRQRISDDRSAYDDLTITDYIDRIKTINNEIKRLNQDLETAKVFLKETIDKEIS